MNKLTKISCVVIFCLCANNILYAQSEPVPSWYHNRNSLKEGNNFAYAVGVGEGNSLEKAKEKALDVAIKEAIQYLRSVNIAEADIDSRVLKIRMNDNSNASWKIVCLKELKVEKNDTKHKVYILYRFKKDIYKEFGDNTAYIDCDDSFEIKLREYYKYYSVGIAKTADPTKIGESYSVKVGTEKPSDFEIVTPADGNLILSLESFAENTCLTLYNEDGVSFKPTGINIVSGETNKINSRIYYKAGSGNCDGDYHCTWNRTAEKFKGSFTFKLDAGIYYIRIFRGQTGLSTVNLSTQFKALK